jgi:hypothetical protein
MLGTHEHQLASVWEQFAPLHAPRDIVGYWSDVLRPIDVEAVWDTSSSVFSRTRTMVQGVASFERVNLSMVNFMLVSHACRVESDAFLNVASVLLSTRLIYLLR